MEEHTQFFKKWSGDFFSAENKFLWMFPQEFLGKAVFQSEIPRKIYIFPNNFLGKIFCGILPGIFRGKKSPKNRGNRCDLNTPTPEIK
jgi:hypothetical protein